VRHGQVHSHEIQISQKAQSRSQFIRSDMKTRVLGVDLAGAQGGILHFRGERMGNRITKNAEANRQINVARDIIPLLKISKCVALGGLPFHLAAFVTVIPSEVEESRGRTKGSFAGSFDSASLRSG
jgi:hypothetical protein